MMYYENLLFLNIGAQETILIVFAILLLFGGKKLPELARGLGKGMREFKDASDGVKREIHRNINSLSAEEELKKQDESYNSYGYEEDYGLTADEDKDTTKPEEEKEAESKEKSVN